MKKLRIFSVLLLLAAAAVFGAFRIYEKGIEDHDAPVIACQTDLISVSVSDGEEKLLEGVTANDSREGDLTSRVVVQDISEMQEDGTRQITYAVSDSRGNVGYASRKMQYTDYSRPVFQLQRPLMFPLGSPFNVCEGLTASGSLDGDLTDKIKYTLDQTISTAVEGSYTVNTGLRTAPETPPISRPAWRYMTPGIIRLMWSLPPIWSIRPSILLWMWALITRARTGRMRWR